MVEDITTIEEEEKVFFPKVDRGRLYSVILICVITVAVYTSIILNMFWISVFIVIPILSVSKREETSQAKFNLKMFVLDSLSNLVRLVVISAIIVLYLYLFIKIGILITVILIFISFLLYNYISTSIIRRNFIKNKRMKSEVY
jgi:hypothetical protein